MTTSPVAASKPLIVFAPRFATQIVPFTSRRPGLSPSAADATSARPTRTPRNVRMIARFLLIAASLLADGCSWADGLRDEDPRVRDPRCLERPADGDLAPALEAREARLFERDEGRAEVPDRFAPGRERVGGLRQQPRRHSQLFLRRSR